MADIKLNEHALAGDLSAGLTDFASEAIKRWGSLKIHNERCADMLFSTCISFMMNCLISLTPDYVQLSEKFCYRLMQAAHQQKSMEEQAKFQAH